MSRFTITRELNLTFIIYITSLRNIRSSRLFLIETLILILILFILEAYLNLLKFFDTLNNSFISNFKI